MSKDKSGPAFPLPMFPQGVDWNMCGGMSLRDYFASKAMQGTLANPRVIESIANLIEGTDIKAAEAFARMNYAYADAMLTERNK